MNLADALTSKTYTRGSVIIQQGDPADGMYFVETGEVSVTVVGNDGTERQVCSNISLKPPVSEHVCITLIVQSIFTFILLL